MKRTRTLFICAGEASGDTLGALLLQGLARQAKESGVDLRVLGMGGPKMRAVSGVSLAHMEDVQGAGLAELVPRLPRIIGRFASLKAQAAHDRPDLAVLIDFPDFNLRLAKRMKSLGIPVVIYVPPQVWAWRAQRVETLKRVADKVVTLFDFEAEFLQNHGLEAVCCGHPLARMTPLAPEPEQPRLLLCPGSRTHEINAIFPIQLDAVKHLLVNWSDQQIRVLVAPGKDELIATHLRRAGLKLGAGRIAEGWTLAFCAAGTVTLELALAGVPWVLTHRVSPLSHWLMRGRLKTPFLGMPNILVGRMVAPERVQGELEPYSLAQLGDRLIGNDKRRNQIKKAWISLREQLRAPKTYTVAELVWEMLVSKEENGL